MRALVGFAIAFTFLLQPAVAGTKYVDSSIGDDSGPGTSGAPYRTIRTALQSVVPGDTIRIRSGLTYYEEELFVDVPDLWITNWGPGKPTIRGSLSLDPAVNVPPAADGPPRLFRKVDVFRIEAGGTAITRLIIEDAWHVGIAMRNDSGFIDDIVIRGCETRRSGSSGIYIEGGRNVELGYNTVREAVLRFANECISLARSRQFDLHHNTITDRFPKPMFDGDFVNGGEGIDVKVDSRNGLIRWNRLTNIDGKFGIYLDGWEEGVSGVRVYNNFVRNCGAGVSVASEMGGTVSDIAIHGNVVTECDSGVFLGDHQGVVPNHPVDNVRIQFNTFVGNNGAGVAIRNPDLTNLQVNNNILIDNGKSRGDIASENQAIYLAGSITLASGLANNGWTIGNNLVPTGSDMGGTNNRFTPNQTSELWVQNFGPGQPHWNSPVLYFPVAGSKAIDKGWNTLIGERVFEDGEWVRLDIGYKLRRNVENGVVTMPNGKQDIGAREVPN